MWKLLSLLSLVAGLADAAEAGRLNGVVKDAGGAGIGGAQVWIHWDPASATASRDPMPAPKPDLQIRSANDGTFAVELAPGYYDIFVAASAFTPVGRRVHIDAGESTETRFQMTVDPLYTLAMGNRITPMRRTSTSSISAPFRYMGRAVSILEAEREPDGFFPLGPASVCVEDSPQQCYTAPPAFGNSPTVREVRVDQHTEALLFSAASGGVSGWTIHFALLRPGSGRELENLFLMPISVSNQSQQVFWNDPSVSTSSIFVTADHVWGPDEGHFGPHRFMVSAYVRRRSDYVDGSYYFLEDRYMTVNRYDLEKGQDVLGAEKREALSRLRLRKPARRGQ